MSTRFLAIFVIGFLLAAGLSGCEKEAKSQAVIDGIFAQEMTLKELAKTKSTPRRLTRSLSGGGARSASISTPTTKAAIWGGANEITMSLLKTDVFDRRYIDREHFTMDKMLRGAYAEVNKDVDLMLVPYNTLMASNGGGNRPGYFVYDERGGGYNPSMWSQIYPFPCQKPVGQIIVKAEEFEDAPLPESVQQVKNGVTGVTVNKSGKKLNVNYVIGMKRNITAVDLSYEGLSKPISFRLYRHQDQGHYRYMNADGSYKKIPQYYPADKSKPIEYYDFNADKEINGRFEPPTSGVDGRFFWVHQVFPKEKTFPQGFRYVMMGMVSGANAEVTAMGLAKNLGTPPSPVRLYDPALDYYNADVSNALGVAANAKLPATSGNAKLYIAVVTVNDTPNYMEEAKKMLLEAEKLGFEGIVAENEAWYNAFYEKREQGRILMGATPEERKQTADIFFNEVFTSWTSGHMGYNNPDPRNLESTASYAMYEADIQNWHSMPCYNELFTEGKFFMRNQYEPKMLWPNLLTQWHETLKEKARVKFGLPGMTIAHGYLPPLSKEAQSPWYCENYVLDYTMEVPGQVMKVVWNFWDYTANEEMLKNTIYPLLKDLAIFYEAFARRGWDGKVFNLEPTVETEAYGMSYRMRYTRNNTGALTMFRWTLNTAIEAAQYLNVDADLIPGWREVAENLAPYPKYMIGGGEILGNNEVFFPSHGTGDHGMKNVFNVSNLSDEINLDSPKELKDMMIRTSDIIRTSSPYIHVGASGDYVPARNNNGAVKIENHVTLANQVVSTPERLMNSRSGRIHLFPAIPEWTVVTFRGFLARGGFEVSAARNENGVQAVTVKARRSIPLQLMNPWVGKNPTVTDITTGKSVSYKMDKSNGECIVFNAETDHTYSFDL